ncbi:MAG: 4Fe-4S binding protein [Deltaproteobacteria bacterium]|jgi:polyferredoxin|nr:4Fe-4S binding protein [Deltaproteobacteria bacterium]
MSRLGRKTLTLIRRLTAWSLLALLTASILDPESWPAGLAGLADFQFGQLAASLFSGGPPAKAAVLAVMALTVALAGRWFCGWVCPLGAAMDLLCFVRDRIKPLKRGPRPARRRLLAVPTLLWLLFWLGLTAPWALLEPYSLTTSIKRASPDVLCGPTALILAAVLAAALRWGRAFCNCLCPTGLVLKLLARASVFGLRLEADKCLRCGACSRACQAGCLDVERLSLDRGRCLVCLECLPACPNGSLKWGAGPERALPGRRGFLRLASLGALAGGAALTSPEARAKLLPAPPEGLILPPGAGSIARLNARCTLCHTCVRACPNGALVPASGWGTLMWRKPTLDPYQGFCQYDCVICTRICPAGALQALTPEAKRLAQLGVAQLERRRCLVVRNGTSCGACAELCPTAAVTMAPGPSGRDEPTLRPDACIGCGACQKACPVRPVSAILVKGLAVQRTAKPPAAVERPGRIGPEQAGFEDFPF